MPVGKVVGASDELEFDEEFSLTSQLPWTVEITPSLYVSSQFWYAGDYYRYGWEVSMLESDVGYARLPFECNPK